MVIFPDVVIAAEALCPVGTTSPTDETLPLPLNVDQSAAERVPVADALADGILIVRLLVEVETYQVDPVVEVAIERRERTLLYKLFQLVCVEADGIFSRGDDVEIQSNPVALVPEATNIWLAVPVASEVKPLAALKIAS